MCRFTLNNFEIRKPSPPPHPTVGGYGGRHNQVAEMSATHAALSWGLSQVSVTVRVSIVLEIIRSVREVFFPEWNKCKGG